MVIVPAVGIIVVVLATFKIGLVKKKTVPRPMTSVSIQTNNQSYNKDTYNVGLFMLLLIAAALCVPLYYLGHQSETLMLDSTGNVHHLMAYLVSDIGHETIFMIVLPLAGYVGNQDLRAYVLGHVRSQLKARFWCLFDKAQ